MIRTCSCPEGRRDPEECKYCSCGNGMYGETGYYFMFGLNGIDDDDPQEVCFN